MMRNLLVFFTFLLVVNLYAARSPSEIDGINLTVLTGSSVQLPCYPTSEDKGAAAIIVLWYRDDNPEPFYSYDLRQTGGGRHWSDESVFGRRVQFDASRHPLRLIVDPTHPEDEGTYRCRVDYERGPSKTALVNLQVVVLPGQPIITDESGEKVHGKIGPYLEGRGTILTCKCIGGRPTPSLTWLRDGKIIETSDSVDPQGQVRSLLHLQHITRDLLDVTFTCRAENNNKTKPLETSITIDMTLAPLNVFLRRRGGSILFVREGKLEEIECVTVGGRPEPLISWWRDRSKIFTANITELRTMNKTVSSLPIIPQLSDHGAELACKVSNPILPGSELEASLVMNIHYPPKVKLLKGSGLNPTAVREGADFYLDCLVKANPPAYKISWRHEGKEIVHNISAGIIISNQTLVLQGVGRKSAGIYQCKAINLHGHGISNDIQLNVLYSPVCSAATPTVIEVFHKATANITCIVHSEPRNATFKWQFNSSGGIIEIESDRFTSRDNWSVLPYTPASPGDYGLLLCLAENEIGKQERPCVINVTAAVPPKLVENCQIRNQTSHALLVICQAIETKLKTTFRLEVHNLEDESIVTSVRNRTPHFLASGLAPGTAYVLKVAVNTSLGESEPITLKAFTVKMAEKRMGVHKLNSDEKMSLVPVVIGTVTALLTVIGLIIVVGLRFCPYRRQEREDTDSQLSNYTQEGQLKFDSSIPSDSTMGRKSSRSTDNNSPDLIPASCDGEYQLKELRVLSTYNDITLPDPPTVRYSGAKTSSGTLTCMINPKFCNTDPSLGTLKKCINRSETSASQDVSNCCSTYPTSSSGIVNYQRSIQGLDTSTCSYPLNVNPPPPPFQDSCLNYTHHLLKPPQLQCCENLGSNNEPNGERSSTFKSFNRSCCNVAESSAASNSQRNECQHIAESEHQ